MKQCSPLCNKILGVIRLVMGLWMIYAGLMKLGADAQMIQMVGSAGPALGLSFMSASSRFWIAVVGEILAGLFLVSGCCKLTKIGAWLTIVIMIFALNLLGWTTPDSMMAWAFLLGAVVILVWGPGSRCFCSCSACKMCADTGSCCGGGSCGSTMKDGMQQMKAGAATMGAGAVASATEMMDSAKEKAEDIVEDAEEVMDSAKEKVEDMAENAKDMVDEAKDKVEDMVEDAEEMIDEKTA